MGKLEIDRRKVRTSITLNPDLFKWVESKIKEHEFASVTHAVEKALYLLKEKME